MHHFIAARLLDHAHRYGLYRVHHIIVQISLHIEHGFPYGVIVQFQS